VAVADSNTIRVYDSTGKFLFSAGNADGSPGTGNGQFAHPLGVAVGPSGTIAVADAFNHRIQLFDAAGNFQTKFGSYGSGNGQFNTPQGLAISPNGNIAVVDTGNHRIQLFDGTGKFLIAIGGYGSGNGQFNT